MVDSWERLSQIDYQKKRDFKKNRDMEYNSGNKDKYDDKNKDDDDEEQNTARKLVQVDNSVDRNMRLFFRNFPF